MTFLFIILPQGGVALRLVLCLRRLSQAEYHEQEEIFKLRLGHLKKVMINNLVKYHGISFCIDVCLIEGIGKIIKYQNQTFQLICDLILNLLKYVLFSWIPPAWFTSVFIANVWGWLLCVAGGGGDPGGAGEAGASAEPAHPWAEENPQRGQLSVRPLCLVRRRLLPSAAWCNSRVRLAVQLKLFPILCRFKDHPTLNDRYLLLHLLGRGGFSEVYKVRRVFFCIIVIINNSFRIFAQTYKMNDRSFVPPPPMLKCVITLHWADIINISK